MLQNNVLNFTKIFIKVFIFTMYIDARVQKSRILPYCKKLTISGVLSRNCNHRNHLEIKFLKTKLRLMKYLRNIP